MTIFHKIFQVVLPVVALSLITACAGSGDGQKKLPVAKRVPGQDGLVFSPYATSPSHVDVKGLEKGTVVKDPYTNDLFRVP